MADLVDLELELNSLQQGLTQMERITPSDPFGSKDDPFGDSFIMYPVIKNNCVCYLRLLIEMYFSSRKS